MASFMPFSSGPCIHCRHRHPSRIARSGGFTYLGMLILLAIIGVASAATLQVGSVLQRREAEEELLEIGGEFRNALLSYADATPVGQPRSPKSLKDLVRDPRYPSVRRHLRKLYADPMTGKDEWGVVQGPGEGGGIIGVYSLSTGKPIKVGNFDLAFLGFGKKNSYREWVFRIPAQPNAVPIPETP